MITYSTDNVVGLEASLEDDELLVRVCGRSQGVLVSG